MFFTFHDGFVKKGARDSIPESGNNLFEGDEGVSDTPGFSIPSWPPKMATVTMFFLQFAVALGFRDIRRLL